MPTDELLIIRYLAFSVFSIIASPPPTSGLNLTA
jgi:hypothetical protein